MSDAPPDEAPVAAGRLLWLAAVAVGIFAFLAFAVVFQQYLM